MQNDVMIGHLVLDNSFESYISILDCKTHVMFVFQENTSL